MRKLPCKNDLDKLFKSKELRNNLKIYLGHECFNGKLIYRLKNLESQENIILGEEKNVSVSASNGVDYLPTAIEVELVQTSIEVDMAKLKVADGTYRIELIALQNGQEINVWSTKLQPYYFTAKGLENMKPRLFKVTLAQAKEGGRLRFKAPLDNAEFEHSFDEGTELTLVSETAEDYELKEVRVNGQNIYEDGLPIKIIVEKDVSIEPIYAKKKVALPQLSAKNGTLTYADYKAGDLVELGTTIKLNATANADYELASLTHNGVDIKGSKSFVLAKTNAIVARFTKEKVALPKLTAQNGTLTYVGHQAGDLVELGTTIKLKATANEDYELASLTHNGADIKGSKSFVLAKTNPIVARFTKEKVALPQLTAENGSLTYVGHKAGDLVELGTKITLEVRADEGYELAVLMHNGADIMDSKTFVLEDGNKIEVKFTKSLALNSLEQSVEVYPNPATDYVILKGFTPNEEVYLLTMAGKTVLSVKLDAEGSAKLKVASLPRGLYLLRSKTTVRKLQVR